MKNHRTLFLIAALVVCCLSGCKKVAEAIAGGTQPAVDAQGFSRYLIRSGQQYCEQNGYKAIELGALSFVARFDSSAIYSTIDPANQYDINKLFGFSDNNTDHHQFSARYGWRWSDGALRLFAYVYNQGAVISKELGSFAIGSEISCSIQVNATSYTFITNGSVERLPRMATTTQAKGYQLYPYFGGDEKAPHDIRIWIRQN